MKTFAFMLLVSTVLAAPFQQAANASCSAIQCQLEHGIQQNLKIQAQELKGVQTLQSMVQGGAVQATAFQATQSSVLKIQQRGIAARANNQKLAQQINSPAADGLATVAAAQVMEMTQVQGLTGTSADADTLTLLVQEVQGGTKQNQMNLAAAKSQKCTT